MASYQVEVERATWLTHWRHFNHWKDAQRQRAISLCAPLQAAVKAFGVAAASSTLQPLDANPPPPPTPFGMTAMGAAGAEVESLIAATEAARRQQGSDNGEFQ